MNIVHGHTIEKLTFDIQIPNENFYTPIADLISSITEHELSAILEGLLNKYNIQDQTIRIPEIELDLGNITQNETRNHLISKFKSSLEKWFEEKFVVNNYQTDMQIKTFSLSDREFNLIKYFITYGKIPWWGANPPFIPDESLKKYIREESGKTKNLIFTLGKEKTTRKRIVYQFKDETLYQLFGILSPRPSSFFKQYATDLSEIHQKQKVVEEEDRAFKKVLQELILTYLISHTSTSIDQTAFFKNQLLLLSKQYGISYKTLLDRINEAIISLPESYPQTFGIKSMVKELLKRDFLNITLPKPSQKLDFDEYSALLTLFYSSNSNQLTGKYRSKKERDRLLRLMIRQNKKKTFLVLTQIHRKLNISKVHSANLFSESILLEMLEIWNPTDLNMITSLIDSFQYLNHKYFIFTKSNLSVSSIIYAHILSHTFTKQKTDKIVASQLIKNITKTYNLDKEFLLRHLYIALEANSANKKSKPFYTYLKDEKKVILTLKEYDKLNLLQLKNITTKLLSNNFPLFEEFSKIISSIYPTLQTFINQPSFYTNLINKWMDMPERNEHFPHFIDELITIFSQKIPLDNRDIYQSLINNKKAISSKLFKAIQHSSKKKRAISEGDFKQLFSDPTNYDKLDLPQLKNILAQLLKGNYPIFEEFIKKVFNIYPSLKSFINQPGFYIFLINMVLLNQSTIYKIDHFFLKVISRLANKLKTPLKTFIFPLLKTHTVIPDKLTKTLRLVYETIITKDPTYTETVEIPFKAAESIEKLIEILGSSLFNSISLPENADKTTLFLEVLLAQRELILEKLFENKFNPNISFLLVNGLPEEALQFLQMSIAGESYNELTRASNEVKNWFNRYNIIKIPRNKIGLWIKQNTLHFIILKGGTYAKSEDYYQFILEKLQKERILQLKELDKTLENLPKYFQGEIVSLISEQNSIPLPKAWRDNQYFNDILIHYFVTGKIQAWINTPYLEKKELEFIFKEGLKSENISLIKGILAMPMHLNILNRILSLLGKTDPLVIIHQINKIYPEKSVLSFYQSVIKTAIGLQISSDIKESIFIFFMQNKLWSISNQILKNEILTDNIYKKYKVNLNLGEVNITGQAFKLTWLQYYFESGFWPEGFPEESLPQYFEFLRLRILENPILLLNITESLSYRSFHQKIIRKIFSAKEIALIFNKIIQIKNLSSLTLDNIIEMYLVKDTAFILKNHLEILYESLLSLLLFERNQKISIENQLTNDLSTIIPEIKSEEKPDRKRQFSYTWEKEMALLEYFLTYGSVPVEYTTFNAERWPALIENLKLNAPRNLMYKLHFWSKTPYKINRLLEIVSDSTAISLISLIHYDLYEELTLLEKSVETVTGEKMRLKLGLKDEKSFLKNILFFWSKSQKIQPSPIPIVYQYFSSYIEKKRLQPGLLLALLVEKIKNVSSKQINVIKSLQKYTKDTKVEKAIKKEIPISQEGLPPESIYVANAGLILLWPFLGRFFRRLNLVGTKEFIDEACLMRGILLTQYLVTGKKEAPEYELALNKLLCGADMDMEIDSEIEITEEEINLSNSLLTGAITNWEKLKGTRIGTFRETFLQRNGSLYYMNNRWELKVEKKAYDLLLETLPWGIQMIQMSWMKERLVVLWR